jgi:hypothetical protein
MAELQKKYLYRIYRADRYLGLLKNVTSDFAYSQNIGTAFASLKISVQQNPITSDEAVEPVLDENGLALTTELGETITTEGSAEVLGIDNNDALIRNNNTVRVYEVSERYPEGTLVFSGRMVEWHANIGTSQDITIEVLSDGADLDNYIVAGVSREEQQQAFSDASYLMYDPEVGVSAEYQRYGQVFLPSALIGNPNIRTIYLDIEPVTVAGDVIVKLWNNATDFYSDAEPLGTARQTITERQQYVYHEFDFGEAIPVDNVNPVTYFFSVQSADHTRFNIYYSDDLGNYVEGEGLLSLYGGAGADAPFVAGGLGSTVPFNLYFDTYSRSLATDTSFNNATTGSVVRQVMNAAYVENGGLISYDNTSVPNTGEYVTYTFKVNTVWEAIIKMLEMSADDYYMYVDVAESKLYFRAAGGTADHTLILGRHIESIDIGATVKQVRNNIFYTGGDTGAGENLYLNVRDEDAIDDNAGWIGLERLNNNRVADVPTGTQEAEAFIEANKNEKYPSSVIVNDETYDINLFKLGEIVGFAGFGNAVDALLLQIVSISRTPHAITLGLGALPFKASTQLDKINRQLIATQTVDNPTTPS